MFVQDACVGVDVNHARNAQSGNDDPRDEAAGKGGGKDKPKNEKRDNDPIHVGTVD